MRSAVDLAPDSLPQRLSPRTGTVDRLTAIARSGTVPWIHGSSGLGKSRLATLLAARWGGLWHIVRLRGLSPTEIRQALRQDQRLLAATRQRRIARTRDELLEGKTRPCCWAGCIHRTDKAPSRWQQAVLIDDKEMTSPAIVVWT